MNQIVSSLVEEIEDGIKALQAARDAIMASNGTVHSVQSKKTARKTMSVAARKRIGDSIKKRWADKKKADKAAAK